MKFFLFFFQLERSFPADVGGWVIFRRSIFFNTINSDSCLKRPAMLHTQKLIIIYFVFYWQKCNYDETASFRKVSRGCSLPPPPNHCKLNLFTFRPPLIYLFIIIIYTYFHFLRPYRKLIQEPFTFSGS